MKKNLYNLLFLLACFLLPALNSCSDEEIVFEHELPQFELRDDAILLEVIMPQGTAVDETIFIAGDFNGGEEVAAEDLRWQLEKATNSDVKWGIYLYPSDFVNGKTLADGFYFVSKQQGVERTVLNEDPVHNLDVKVGTRTNVTVNRWKAYFDVPANPDEVTHDGYAVFVVDNTGWDELALYAWGSDLPELFGGWPGITPTGTVDIKGVTFKYFDTGAANEGLNYNLIFNNNGNNSQLADYNYTLDHDVYLELTADGVKEIDPDNIVTHDGYAVFVDDQTGWDELALYAWGSDLPELFGGWPGATPTGTVDVNGVTYKYFDTGAANTGLTYNLIFNNNGNNSQLADYAYTIDHDLYLRITTDGVTVIDPENPGESGEETPVEPTPEPADYSLYVLNTTDWEAVAVYAYGDKEFFGGWPGAAPAETVTIAGKSMLRFAMNQATGEALNLIFNNNGGGTQLADFAITANRDYYLEISAEGCKEIDRPTADYSLYVLNNTGWDAVTVYAWGDKKFFGGWPGAAPAETVTIAGKSFLRFAMNQASSENLNLIFNNNGGGTQLSDFAITADRDYYLEVTAESCKKIDKPEEETTE